MALELRPCTITAARAFVSEHHRHLRCSTNYRWAVRAERDGVTVGVAIVGAPARLLMEQGVLEVVRLATLPGARNACSMLYGSCARAAKALGASGLVTYTRMEESGVSLVAAGWIRDGLTSGGEMDRPSRPRAKMVDARPKHRWWAPFSRRAQRVTAEWGLSR